MYLRPAGATTVQITKACGGAYLNCLTVIKAKGHQIQKTKIKGPGGKLVTAYRVVLAKAKGAGNKAQRKAQAKTQAAKPASK